MMKIYLTFSIILFVTIAFPQSTEPIKLKRFSLGLAVSPDMAYINARESLSKNETPRLGITAGGSFSFDITKRFSAETGAAYSLKGYSSKSEYTVLTYGAEVLYEGESRLRQNLNCLDVPLQFNYVFFNGKCQLIVNTGVVWTHMFHHSQDFLVPTNGVETIRDWVTVLKLHTPYASNTISSTIGVGFRFAVSDRMSLNVIPTFQYAWIPINTNLMSNDVTPYSVRLSFGFKYSLF